MNYLEFINNINNPVILVKDKKIKKYNKSFAELGDFDINKKIDDIFYMSNNFSFIKTNLNKIKTWLIIYQEKNFEINISKIDTPEFDYIIYFNRTDKKTKTVIKNNILKKLHLGYFYIELDKNYDVIDCDISPNIYYRFGLDKNKNTYKNFFNIFPDDLINSLTKNVKSVAKNINSQFDEFYKIKTPRLPELFVFIRGFSTIKNNRPFVVCSSIEFSDINLFISEKSKLESSFYELFNNNISPILIIENGKILSFNKNAYQQALKYDIELQNNSHIKQYIAQEQAEIIYSKIKETKKFEISLITANKQKIWVEFSTIPLKFIGEKAFALIINDITKHKKLIYQIKENEKKYKNILNKTSDAITLVDDSGTIEFWNNTAKKLFNYKKEEIIGEKIFKLFKNKKDIISFNKYKTDFKEKGIIHHNKKNKFIVKVKTKDKKFITAEFLVSKFKYCNKWKAIATIRDVSKKIEIDNELNKRKEKLKEANNTLKKFISIIAHDLRSPLAQITNILELVSEENDRSNQKQYLNLIKKSADNGLNLLEFLLKWGKTVSNNIVFSPQKIDIDTIINSSIEFNSSLLLKKLIKIKKEETEIKVNADPNMLKTIFNNLLSNAIKFSKIRGEIKISVIKKDRYAQICIKDKGIGMDEQTVDEIFKLNKTEKIQNNEDEKSTGLGLILTKEFVKKNGGKIWVKSSKNIGSEFCFTLPLAD